jgi:hypothetical protein
MVDDEQRCCVGVAECFPFPFTVQENGNEGLFRRWLGLTQAPLTGINFAGHGDYPGGYR